MDSTILMTLSLSILLIDSYAAFHTDGSVMDAFVSVNLDKSGLIYRGSVMINNIISPSSSMLT